MKTAISIPDPIFRQAERFAKERQMSRSQLYARAVEEYVKKHRREGLTERINEAIKGLDTSLPPDIEAANLRTLRKAEW